MDPHIRLMTTVTRSEGGPNVLTTLTLHVERKTVSGNERC